MVGDGKPKAGYTIHKETHNSNVFPPKQPQSTWQAETVVGSSLTHHAALLVPLSGSIDPVVDPRARGFTGPAKDRL